MSRCIDSKTGDFETILEADEDESIQKENQTSLWSNHRRNDLNLIMDERKHDMEERTSNER